MGTWDAGPFANDAALDFVGGIVDELTGALREFMDEPMIDETFDAAFAAIAILNGIMAQTPCRPWDHEANATLDPAPICAAMLACFDEQIDGMEPQADFKRDHRAALVAALDAFAGHFA